MRRKSNSTLAQAFLLWLTVFAGFMQRSLLAQAGKLEPGLVVIFAALDDNARATDLTVTPNVCLYVEAGKAPTPFLPAGKFTAVWTGFVAVEIRSDFTFSAVLNGELIMQITG